MIPFVYSAAMLSYNDRPLKDRIIHARDQHVPSSFIQSQGRPSQYKHWNPESLFKAYEAVTKQGCSVRRAAEEYRVPRSTLHDRVSGRIQHGATSGPPRYLSDEEEKELAEFLRNCAKVGYARTRLQVITLVQQTLKDKGLDVRVSNGWWESFKRRNPKLALRTAEPLSYARLIAGNPEVLNYYYDLLENTLMENDLMDKPSQIFNTDETGLPLDPASLKVIVPSGYKHSQAVSTGNKAQVTVLACCNAAGYTIPPLVIFDRKTLKPEMTVGEVPGTMYGLSSSGWIDTELFELWFAHHFLAHAPPVRPLLLLLDGHSSHFQPSFVRRAAEEQVIVFCLPPHTTHLTQPLDKGCFGPLKMFWRQECQSYLSSNPGKVVTQFQFSQLFSKAWLRGMSMSNIIAGFRMTGIYPFDRYALRPQDDQHKKSIAEKNGLKFIPMFTPKPRRSRGHPETPMFSEEEVQLFQKRLEEGYDIQDERYDLWKRMYHPAEARTASSPVVVTTSYAGHSPTPLLSPVRLSFLEEKEEGENDSHSTEGDEKSFCKEEGAAKFLPRTTALSKVLSHPEPQLKPPVMQPKSSARVLTSLENLRALEEKERKKMEEQKLKEERRRERERKRQEKRKMVFVVVACCLTT